MCTFFGGRTYTSYSKEQSLKKFFTSYPPYLFHYLYKDLFNFQSKHAISSGNDRTGVPWEDYIIGVNEQLWGSSWMIEIKKAALIMTQNNDFSAPCGGLLMSRI